jgi:hypothetical protein
MFLEQEELSNPSHESNQGRIQKGGTARYSPPNPQNLNSKTTDFVDIII